MICTRTERRSPRSIVGEVNNLRALDGIDFSRAGRVSEKAEDAVPAPTSHYITGLPPLLSTAKGFTPHAVAQQYALHTKIV